MNRRTLLKKLRAFGVQEISRRGKGSHRMLIREDPEPQAKRLAYPLAFHGIKEVIQGSIIKAIRRKLKLIPEFGVTDKDFDEA